MIKTPLSTVIGGAFWTPGATIIGGTSKTLNQLIKSLFANGEQGFFYDPNDLSTMFQDSAGTTPVTSVGQPVGLVLDKSKALVVGSERLVNGDFSNGLNNWTNGNSWWSVVNGRAYHGLTSNLNTLDQIFTATKNTAIVQFDAEVLTASGTAQALAIPSGLSINLDSGVRHYKFYAPTGTTGVQFKRAGGGFSAEFYIDNVSVKELAGNHAYQTTSSMRPLLVASPQRLDFDTADDKLITALPAQLTGCTVIRAVPNVGTQILTNQTIPTPYNDNTDHCGLIVINRALTPSETSAITAEFNKRAGV